MVRIFHVHPPLTHSPSNVCMDDILEHVYNNLNGEQKNTGIQHGHVLGHGQHIKTGHMKVRRVQTKHVRAPMDLHYRMRTCGA